MKMVISGTAVVKFKQVLDAPKEVIQEMLLGKEKLARNIDLARSEILEIECYDVNVQLDVRWGDFKLD
jgi:hypothetical protein